MFKGLKKKFSNAGKENGKEKAATGSSSGRPAPSSAGSDNSNRRPSGNNSSSTEAKTSGGSSAPPGKTNSGGKPKHKRNKTGEQKKNSASSTRNTVKKDERPLTKADLLKQIATFQETSAANKPNLFIYKLRLCQVMFDWEEYSSPKDNRAKEIKRQQLLELVEFLGNGGGKNKALFTDAVLVEIINMVSANLFRALPPRQNDTAEDDDPVFEPSWPHLQICYEFFLRFIVSGDVDVRTLKKHITGQFVLRLLELFDSEDHRERDYLKTILHRIYAKFMSLRAFIRKAINNVFFIFIYETERHNGIAELLEILGSIINGFALPLKEEHKSFLKNVLTPMHKAKPLSLFHQQLSYCVTQFVDKDPTLAVPVLKGLIKYWPSVNSAKEVLFLNEVEELLELTQAEEFQILLVPLFQQLARSIGSPHFQVAERALFLWHNEYISGLINEHRKEVLPVLYPVLHVNSQSHWNPTVNNLTLNVLKIFMESDSALVEECSKAHADAAPAKESRARLKEETWQKLIAAEEAHEASNSTEEKTGT